MSEPVKDRQTVTPAGEPLEGLLDGMTIRDAVVHVDDRGRVCEIFDPRWRWHEDPLVFVYYFTIRPGLTKGWGLHKRHEDRYFLLAGEMELVLYDVREDSSTFGEVVKAYLSERRHRLVYVPAGVWHADRNIGTNDCLVVNFPTIQYEHADPDKYRLPLDTDQIPYRFEDPSGW